MTLKKTRRKLLLWILLAAALVALVVVICLPDTTFISTPSGSGVENVRWGMTEAEVDASLGKPSGIRPADKDKRIPLMKSWNRGGDLIIVEFGDDQKVTSVGIIPDFHPHSYEEEPVISFPTLLVILMLLLGAAVGFAYYRERRRRRARALER